MDGVEGAETVFPGQPVEHRRLLEIPASRAAYRNIAAVVFQVHQSYRSGVVLLRQAPGEADFQHADEASVRTPGIYAEIISEKVVPRGLGNSVSFTHFGARGL